MQAIKQRTISTLVVSLASLALWIPLDASAQTVRPEAVGLSSARLARIHEMVQRYIDAGDISGAVTLVARNGKIAHLEAQGVMDLASGQPMKTDTIFRIASMSKPVAAVAVLMLVEEGKIRLSDPVSRFIPGFEGQRVAVAETSQGGGRGAAGGGRGAGPFHTVPAERPITVLDLLTHTSGLMSGTISNSEGGAYSADRHELGLAWVERLGATPLEFQPGTRWSYSALAGFDVLSRIVEIASGQRFDQFLEERIFRPLEMEDIFFWPDAEQRSRLVASYNRTADGLEERTDPDSMSGERYFSGAGGLMTTAEAYARFGMMLANGGEWNGTRILGSRTLEVMRSAFIPDTLPGRSPGEGYGLGVRVITDPVAGATLLSEGSFGWSGAYGTHFWADPKENLVGVLMIQTPIREMRPAFETAVMQAVID